MNGSHALAINLMPVPTMFRCECHPGAGRGRPPVAILPHRRGGHATALPECGPERPPSYNGLGMLTVRSVRGRQAGMTMLEVLVTLVILAFGLLGLAGLHIKIQTLDMEAYQRAQAILLLRDMVERIKANSANAADYVPVSPGTP